MPTDPIELFGLCGAAPHFPLSRRHEARASSPIKQFDLDHFILSKQMTLHISQNEVFANESQTLTTVRVGEDGVSQANLSTGTTALVLM